MGVAPPGPQRSVVNKHSSSGLSGNIDSVDASFTSAMVGAGVPGGAASRTPIPTIAAPVTPVVTYWRADIPGARDVVLLWLYTVGLPLEMPATGRSCCVPAEKVRLKCMTLLTARVSQIAI